MSAKAGMRKDWKRERRKRATGYQKHMKKAEPPGGGSKYAKKKATKETT